MRINSTGDMSIVAEKLLLCAPKSEKEGLLLLLRGELGAGKTTFVQALARELGVQGRVTSPTFVIQKEYTIEPKAEISGPGSPSFMGFTRLIHIDAYRLDSLSDLELLGWSDHSLDPGAVIALEWPERVPGVENHTRQIDLLFSHTSADTRSVYFDGKEEIWCT